MEKRFNEDQRREIVSFIKDIFDISLSSIDGYRTVFRGSNGKRYCIIGAHCNWHGVKRNLLISNEAKSTVLVVAIVQKSKYIIYANYIDMLSQNINKLHPGGSDELEFNSREVVDKLHIKEVPGYSLLKIGEIQRGIAIKISDDGSTNSELLDFMRSFKSKLIIRKKEPN